jgi:hypothetical protein
LWNTGFWSKTCWFFKIFFIFCCCVPFHFWYC